MNRTLLTALAALTLTLAGPSRPAHAVEIEGDAGGVKMTLAEALRTALENNLDLVIARKNPVIAEQGIEGQRAAFDPVVGASAGYTDSSSDTTTVTDDGTTVTTESVSSGSNSHRLSANWAQLLKFGGSYQIEADVSSFDQDPTRFFNFGFPGTYERGSDSRGLTLSYTMPLLRGFGREATTADLVLARSRLDVSRNDLMLNATSTLQDVENAYWDLVAVRAALDVARQSLNLAQDLLDLNKKKVEVGTLAPIEITQAEAGVAAREEGVIVAENALEAAEDNLLRLLAVPAGDPMWESRIVPTDATDFREQRPDADAVLAKALELRPEILSARQNVRDRLLSERVAENGVRHGLDLSADTSFGRDESDTIVRIDGSPVTTRDATDIDSGPDWSVGLTYRYPIRNRAAKAAALTATLEREKAEIGVRNVEQTIRVDVRNAVRNVESGAKRVRAAEASTVLQRKKLEAEQKKFDNGMSTSFEVLTFQTDLANAQVSEIRAKLDYIKALADLERAQGTLLEARGLQLAE